MSANSINSTVSLFALSIFVALTNIGQADFSYVDFSGWDSDTVNSTGQVFLNVQSGVDLTVIGRATNNGTSLALGPVRGRIGTGAPGPENSVQFFTFSFSSPLDVRLTVDSVSTPEILTINNSSGAVNYSHSLGAAPTLTGDLSIQGNGFRFGPDGAARGTVNLSSTSSFDWDYHSTDPNRWETFRLSTMQKIVPEPSAGLPLFVGAVFLMERLGRRRSKRS